MTCMSNTDTGSDWMINEIPGRDGEGVIWKGFSGCFVDEPFNDGLFYVQGAAKGGEKVLRWISTD